MPWKDHLKRLKNEFENLIAEPGAQQQPQQPPPQAYAPPPQQQQQMGAQPGQVYWQPQFRPDNPVSTDWDAKIGNADGWGNQELEYYTADQQNAFYTQDGSRHLEPAPKVGEIRLVNEQGGRR